MGMYNSKKSVLKIKNACILLEIQNMNIRTQQILSDELNSRMGLFVAKPY